MLDRKPSSDSDRQTDRHRHRHRQAGRHVDEEYMTEVAFTDTEVKEVFNHKMANTTLFKKK